MVRRLLYSAAMHLIVFGGKIFRSKSRGTAQFGAFIIERVRDDVLLLRQEGTDNPVSVVLLRRRGSRTWAYLTDPGKQWHSFDKNRAFERLCIQHGWRCAGVLLTHSHVDHWGNLGFFLRFLRRHGRVYVHPAGHWAMTNPSGFVGRMEALARAGRGHFRTGWWIRQIYWLWPAYVKVTYGFGIRRLRLVGQRTGVLSSMPTRPFRLNGGTLVEVRHLPGHAPDEVMLWLPDERIAVLGDLVPPQGERTRNTVVSAYVPEADVVQAIASLERLAALRPTVLIPAHGVPIYGEDAIQRLLGETVQTTRRVVDTLRAVWQSHPGWDATRVGIEAFAQCGYRLNRGIGANEMTSYAASAFRSLHASHGPHTA